MNLTTRLLYVTTLLTLLLAPTGLMHGADAAQPAVAESKLYVTIEANHPGDFERMRYAQSDGSELILATLRRHAAPTAKVAGFGGEIIVLDEGAQPPAHARVLRLTWSESVSAEYFDGHKPKPKYLGIVSKTPLSEHPYRAALEKEIVSASGDLARRDAELRASTAMVLYIGVKRTVKRMQSEK